jgi:aryl-alcohol dehydrogenase-like predicted oxidoreductase
VNFFDTAEVYGSGRSERIFGEIAKNQRKSIIIATKFFPFPWRFYPNGLDRALQHSLKRLQMAQVDLYQIHNPTGPFSIEFWLKKIVKTHQSGTIKAVGISNYSLDQTLRAHKLLSSYNIPLASNQLGYSLLDRTIEKNGLLNYCHDNNITVIAYSPLAMGCLTGKYSPSNPPGGVRSRFYKYNSDYLKKIVPLTHLMEEIGQDHGNRTPAQVALNWAISKGTVPIPGVKTVQQAADNVAALQWQLSPQEITTLDSASDDLG